MASKNVCTPPPTHGICLLKMNGWGCVLSRAAQLPFGLVVHTAQKINTGVIALNKTSVRSIHRKETVSDMQTVQFREKLFTKSDQICSTVSVLATA